jgi:hypothetical protein
LSDTIPTTCSCGKKERASFSSGYICWESLVDDEDEVDNEDDGGELMRWMFGSEKKQKVN